MSDKLEINLDIDFDEYEDNSEELEDTSSNSIEEEDNVKPMIDIKSIIGKKNTKVLHPNEEYSLYILMDNKVRQVEGWLINLGIYPTFMSDSIQEMSDMIEVDCDKAVIIVVDTGVGEFNSVENASKLVDLLGMDVFDDKHFFVLYTDDTIKIDTRAKIGRNNIRWMNYKGSKDIFNLIKQNNIKIANSEPYTVPIDSEESLNFKGEPIILNGEEVEFTGVDLSIVDETYALFEQEEIEGIEGFRVVV